MEFYEDKKKPEEINNNESTAIDINEMEDKFENYNPEKLNSLPIIDQLFEKTGLTWTSFKIIILTFFILLIDGFQLTLFSSMIIPLTKYYGLSDMNLKLIPGIIFISVALGSLSLGYLNSIFGRKPLIIIFVLLGLICHFLIIYIKSLTVFAIARGIIGFTLGVTTPTSLAILTEYLPIKRRGFVLCSVWCGYTIGQLALLCIMLYIMPNFEADKVKQTLLVSGFMPLITLVICIFLAYDGPRSLILRGKEKEAIKILEKIYGKPLSNHIQQQILIQTRSGINREVKSFFLDIFVRDYFKTTVLLTFIRISHALYYFGVLMISSITLKYLKGSDDRKNNSEQSDRDVILKEIYIVIFILIGDVFSGIQTDNKYLGRKVTMIMNYSLCTISTILCFILPQNFTLFLAISLFFSSITSVVNHTYCLEVYPTRIRDPALGFLFAARRLGGFLSGIFYIYLNNLNIWVPYYFTAVLSFLNIIMIVCLPYETYNSVLDTDLSKHSKENNYKNTAINEEESKSLINK